jgi:hypothetical protein
MLNKSEIRIAEKVLNVSHIAGKQVVNANDLMTGSKEVIREMGAKKSGSPCYHTGLPRTPLA